MRKRNRYGWKREPSLGKALVYVAALAVLTLITVIIPQLFLIAITYGGGYGSALADELSVYLGFAPALLIPYTWRFWYFPHQMSLATTLQRASICGVLFLMIVSLLMVFAWVLVEGLGCGKYGGVSWSVVVWISSFALSCPLTAIGVVWPPLKQP